MKKIILISLILLNGCALQIGQYDSNEYMLVNQIRTKAQLQQCTKKNVDDLYFIGLQLKNYSQYLPDNEQVFNLTNDLFTIIDELNKRENFSIAFCQAKLNIIEVSAEKIQQVIGNKPR